MRYQARVFRLASRLTSNTDAPDVLQEAFLQVYRHIANFLGAAQQGKSPAKRRKSAAA